MPPLKPPLLILSRPLLFLLPPLIASTAWFTTLLILLLYWLVHEHSAYYAVSMASAQRIAFISDVAANATPNRRMYPVFITGCLVTALAMSATLALDWWWLHRRGLVRRRALERRLENRIEKEEGERREKGGGKGVNVAAGLVLGFAYHPEQRPFRFSYYTKVFFVVVEVSLAIAFFACVRTRHYQPAAVLEWVIALIFAAWAFSFCLDLYPAARQWEKQRRQQQEEEEGSNHEAGDGAVNAEMENSNELTTHPARLTKQPTSRGYLALKIYDRLEFYFGGGTSLPCRGKRLA
ncbi:uncharacterized protein CTHT_0061560 [Thermochaetoides thermophila DSM 1495]|uniref:CWH43-like N-terminal domain-containing protein n=1 Tax=Chaetomium thermophilum (strain DSM 1495 / CBS 144.50 / IMI 039719) TaxID=759272 RepID=G0SFC5_CHATD|nr:hypothetical protein CTHT_0061560 [Thermochaetoides thermophila DSM 1495]EGS18141.1 hypothetical protein CTHT_0061560 [Thermochaetoides thermophila DSM 1495]